MTTISVPLDEKHMEHLAFLKELTGASQAAVMRKALERTAEEEAINHVLISKSEKTIQEDAVSVLRKIVQK